MYICEHDNTLLLSIITHWTHMDEMEWFSSAMFGVLAAIYSLGFGLALAGIRQTFGQQQ